MGKWMTLTYDFDRSKVIKRIRNTKNHQSVADSQSTGFFTESPNIDLTGKAWNAASGSMYGYGTENRFNMNHSNFCNRYYNFTDVAYSSTTAAHTTLVSGETYEFVCPVDMYWGGLSYPNVTSGMLSDCFEVYVEYGISIDKETLSFSSSVDSDTITIDSESPWTATTNDSWITLSQYSGETGGEITVSVASNLNNPLDRTGVVTFTDGENTATLTITQKSGGKTVILKNLYRSGNEINLMFRNGRKIYQGYSKTGV